MYLQGNKYVYVPAHYEWHPEGHLLPRGR
jgi:hypothetical protein